MYLLLHRAIRNAGDFLIHERARRLIAAIRPGIELRSARAWEPLSEQLLPDQLAACRAVVICGGPGYQPSLYPRLYPLGDLDSLPPVALLALGSAVTPGTDAQLAAFSFDPPTRAFLARAAAVAPLGARDRLTSDLLTRAGFGPVIMTGDPAWYDLEAIDAPVRAPSRIRRLAFTPPANPAWFAQAREVVEQVARQRPDIAISIVHHRGVQRPWHELARRRGWTSLDITGSAAGFGRFDEHDAHLGYRVHAHLYSLSRAVPSWLVAEDSRGRGVHATLGELGTTAWDPRGADGALLARALRVLPRLANAYRPATAWLGMPAGRVLRTPSIAAQLAGQVEADEAAGFARHEQARATIRATLPSMRRMIEALP